MTPKKEAEPHSDRSRKSRQAAAVDIVTSKTTPHISKPSPALQPILGIGASARNLNFAPGV